MLPISFYLFPSFGQPPSNNLARGSCQGDWPEIWGIILTIRRNVSIELIQNSGKLIDEVWPAPLQCTGGEHRRQLVHQPGAVVVEELVAECFAGYSLVHQVRIMAGTLEVIHIWNVEVVVIVDVRVPGSILVLDLPHVHLPTKVSTQG